MSEQAPASYATRRWNPLTGCANGLPCVDRCWARAFATRHRGRFGYPEKDPFRPTFHADRIEEPLRWKGRRVAAVSFMGDVGSPGVKDEWLCALWAIMALTPQHTYLILTKQPGRLGSWLRDLRTYPGVLDAADPIRRRHDGMQLTLIGISNPGTVPLHNVWVGTSFGNQGEYDPRRPELDGVPAAHRWLSYEPATGPVDLDILRCCDHDTMPIGWVAMGAESGPKRRPFDDEWARSVRDRCVEDGVCFYYKQGHDADGDVVKHPRLDGKRWTQVPWEETPCSRP